MDIDERASSVIEILTIRGHQAYLVGGAVRDFLMNVTPKDWDIATSATPDEVKSCFVGHLVTVIDTGLKHGTITVVNEGLSIEVTTFREDGLYTDSRRPSQVTFVKEIKEDLGRRDLTINALAYSPSEGTLDYFGGVSDIKNKILRTVGEADDRLTEDALRIMRTLRFSSVLGFKMEKSLSESIHKNKALLRNISAERVSSELSKIIVGDNVLEILLEYPDVFSVFIPEIEATMDFNQHNSYHQYDVWGHIAHSVAFAAPETIVRLAMLFHDLGKPRTFTLDEGGNGHFFGHNKVGEEIARQRLSELRFDNETIETVEKLVRWHDVPIEPKRLVRWLNKMGETNLRRLLEIKMADSLAQSELCRHDKTKEIDDLKQELDSLIINNRCFNLRDLAVSGKDIIALGVAEGPAVGEILNMLLEKVMDGEIDNKKTSLLDEIEKVAV